MMKRLFSALLLLILLAAPLPACKKTAVTRVYTLNGTTGFGMAPLMTAGYEDYTFQVEKDATAVRAALLAGDCDIAALPTNVAALLYNATEGALKVIALNTGSVLHLVTTGEAVGSLAALSGKTVYTPAQNPAFIFEAILAAAQITDITVDSTTYATPEALRTAVASGLVAFAVLPEPMVTIAQSAAAKQGVTVASLFNLGEVWNSYFPENSLVQGCVVVRTAYLEKHPDRVQDFLEKYKAAIGTVKENPEAAAELIAAAGVFENKQVAAAAIPRCNLIYEDGVTMQAHLSAFLAAMPLSAIGGRLPDANFYYIRTDT